MKQNRRTLKLEEKVNLRCTAEEKQQLEKLARHYGTTKTAMVLMLVEKEVARLGGALDG